MKNITIGQYYPVESRVHSLDPRVKLLSVIVFISMLLMVANAWGYVFAGVCLAAVVYATRVPVKYMLRGLRSILFIVVLTAVMNLFFTAGGEVLFEFWVICVTTEGVRITVMMAVRLTMLVIGSSVLTLTTSPTQLTGAIEFLLKPLQKIGVPSHEIAMMMTIALRFIPTLMEEMDKIMKAQMARGADFDTGGIIKKAKSMVPLLVPLFISAFRRADDLAVAMEARCYRGDVNRTKLRVLKMAVQDWRTMVYVTAFVAAMILIRLV